MTTDGIRLSPGSPCSEAAGNVGRANASIEYFYLPAIEITAPPDLATLTSTTVRVEGVVDDPSAAVDVNGVSATLLSDGRFAADGVPLVEGGNVLAATVRTAEGSVNTASVHVVRDLTAPNVEITTPPDGAVVTIDRVAVSGLVNDLVAGTVNAQEATVTVNGVAALVRNRNFLVADIPLVLGENLLTARAVDESGNIAESTIRVRRESAGPEATLRKVSGDLQEGVAQTELPAPLVVAVVSGEGVPLVGRTVLFEEESGGGRLAGDRRRVAVTTDSQGQAATPWTLGRRAGVQRVRASAVGVMQTVDFLALAGPREPAVLVVDAGDQQLGTAGHRLPRPFIATVTDDGFNRLGGVPVEFSIVKGGGTFSGEPTRVVTTDSDGRAVATLTLGPDEGNANNAILARIVGVAESPEIAFTASGRAAGPAEETAITGVVLDNTSRPIEGVTVRVGDTTLWTTTDAAGQFRIEPAPVGDVFLIVDGSTTERPGIWASLEFRMTTISGRENDLGMPTFLLPLDVADGLYVDEVTGGTVTAPDVPGLTLEIEPGSVTFPGGSKSGVVSITTVHSDRVPMTPNFGQQPRLIVTIQPAGARFDPPAKITYPNIEGLAPGESTDLYSFDHDLGHFVSIGPGTVSDDGTVLVSDPGVGILKAGWHCGGNPQGSSGTAHACPECEVCNGAACVPVETVTQGLAQKAAFPCDDEDDCTFSDRCSGGGCSGGPVEIQEIQGTCVAELNQQTAFVAVVNDGSSESRVMWEATDASPPTGQGKTYQVTFGLERDFIVMAKVCSSTEWTRVSVKRGCSSVVSGLSEPEVPTVPPGNSFGIVEPTGTQSAIYTSCVESKKWCFALLRYTAPYAFGVNGGTNIDIDNAQDSDLNASNCGAVIADLTPPASPSNGGPQRSTYWTKRITEVHERVHVQDLHDLVAVPTYADLQAFVANSANCTDCMSATPTSLFNQEAGRLYSSYYNNSFLPVAEPRAHAVSNALYAQLVNDIRQRGQAEGWPLACQ